jgi:hypothetical protein
VNTFAATEDTFCSLNHTQYLNHVSFGLDILSKIPVLSLPSRDFTVTIGMFESKAIPLHAWTGPEGSWRLRLPDFKKVVRFSALRTGRLYPH